jgi:glycosyltransferase involved in cell wall biosynthesis
VIDIVTPTLWRAERLEGYVANIHDATRTDHVVTFVAEKDDEATIAEVARLSADDDSVRLVLNDRKDNVLGAFNAGAAAVTADWWFGSGDDVRFHDGWDEILWDQMAATTRVMGTNDLGNPNVIRGKTATHMLINTDYINRFGATLDLGPGIACCEDYHHGFFDTELVEVAKQRGVWQPCLESIVEHLHFAFGKAEFDPTYTRNQTGENHDWALWAERRKMLENPEC